MRIKIYMKQICVYHLCLPVTDMDFYDGMWHPSWNEFFERNVVNNALQIFANKYRHHPSAYHPLNFLEIFKCIPKHKVRVIIVGKEPYPQRSDAVGIAFSIGSKRLSTSNNISLKKIYTAAGLSVDCTGDLSKWVDQGVFLMNASLTIPSFETNGLVNGNSRINSHKMIWEPLVKEFMRYITEENRCIVCLWGRDARSLEGNISHRSTFVLIGPHPVAPNEDFELCTHFRDINSILTPAIDWYLPLHGEEYEDELSIGEDIHNYVDSIEQKQVYSRESE